MSSKQSNFFFCLNRNKPKVNLFWLFFGLFRETKKHLFRFVSVFWTGIETTETNRTLSKQTKNIVKKHSLLGGARNCWSLFLGSTRNKPKLNLFWLFFSLSFPETKNFFWVYFGVSDRYRNNWNKQNLWYGELKRLIFNKFFAVSVGLLFVSVFETPKLSVSILKRNNRNKRLVSDRAETSLGSSFGCFDTKLVSEDTLFTHDCIPAHILCTCWSYYTPKNSMNVSH